MIGNVLILLIAVFSVIYVGACAYAQLVSDSIIFPVPPASYSDDDTIIKLETENGDRISAYFLEAANPAPVLLYSYGNAEDIGYIRPLLDEFRERGISSFAYDYPGYGTSSGKPSESSVYAAAAAAYLYVTEELDIPPEKIVLYGRSVGSGPASWLAEQNPVAGLILEGAFTSTFRVMTKVKVLPFDKFDNLARLPEMDCPVLLIHGKKDRVISFEHALKNEAALKGTAETLWVEEAGHNNLIETARESYWNAVLSFIRKSTTEKK